MSGRIQKSSRSGVKTVEIQTVKIARSLANNRNSPSSAQAEFAKKLVEESFSRSAALFSKPAKAKAGHG